MKKILYLLFALSMLSACYYDNEQDLYPASGTPDTAAVSYTSTIQPMIANNCALSGCHVTNAQLPDLTTYAGVSANKDRIKARAVDGSPSPMPAAGLMSADNRNKLSQWITAGAPNN